MKARRTENECVTKDEQGIRYEQSTISGFRLNIEDEYTDKDLYNKRITEFSNGSPYQLRQVKRSKQRNSRRIDAEPMLKTPPIYRKSHKRLMRAILVVFCILSILVGASTYLLIGSESGQRLTAKWGWTIAPTQAYIMLGRELLDQAYYTEALEKLSIATEREPDNVDALILMGQAYMELNQYNEAKTLYESIITSIAPNHPAAYRNLIKIYQMDGYNAEALALIKQASERIDESTTSEFTIMLREYTPVSPKFSWEEGRYNEEKDLTITIPDGQTVYYTIDGTDPSEAGLVYVEGTKIHLSEGKTTVKAIGFTADGTPSEQISATYTVIIPTPAAPKANVQSGSYKNSFRVALRPGSEDEKENARIVAIYYTLDKRQATTASTLYNEEEQILIPAGDTTLRAIAVADNGKVSYEMKVTYSVEGNLKKRFTSDDAFKNMELYKTGYKSFTNLYGTPLSYEVLPQESWYSPDMESYKAEYDWGSACFCIKKAGGTPVLYALDTKNSKMTAPRSTRVGMSGDDVIGKFQDLGHPALDDEGNRLLYNLNSGGYMFGSYRNQGDGTYAIHYYYPVDDKRTIFVELSYYLDELGNVERIMWQRYRSEI